MAGQKIDRVLDAKASFDDKRPYADQVRELLVQVPLSTEEWQSLPVVVNLPSHAVIAAGVLANLHGRIGHFPTVVRLKRDSEGAPLGYSVAELVDLQGLREWGRQGR